MTQLPAPASRGGRGESGTPAVVPPPPPTPGASPPSTPDPPQSGRGSRWC